jgi:hypothetical protein
MTIAILTVLVLLLRFSIEEFVQRYNQIFLSLFSISTISDVNVGVVNIGVDLFVI